MSNFNSNFDDDIFDPANYPEPTSAIDELKAINHWVSWRYEQRGTGKPTKPPKNPRNGYGASHSDPSTWGTYEQAAQCAEARGWPGTPYIPTGDEDVQPGTGFVLTEDDGLTGIDLDRCVDPISGKIEPWALEILEIAETYAEFSPSGTGIRMIVRGKAVERAVKRDDIGIEIYRSQRYLTITGRHIFDTQYDICPAPKTIAALLARCEAITPPKHEPEPSKALAPRQKPLEGEIILPRASSDPGARAYAERALELNARELAAHPHGGRNNTLYKKAFRMATMAARGWIDRTTVHAALLDSCITNGYIKDKDRKSFEASFRSGFSSGLEKPHDPLPEQRDDQSLDEWLDMVGGMVDEARGSVLIDNEDGTFSDPETGEVIETTDAKLDAFPDELTYAPGLVGEIAEWILATSMRPHRALALATALTTVGTVCGRYWCGPTDGATNLYVVMLAPTGSGKDHFIRAPGKILGECGDEMERLVGPKKFMSQTAVQSHVQQRPVSICPQDEIGGTIKRMTSKKASNFEASISEELRELWGINFGTTSTAARAASEAVPIYAPCLSILGASTAEEFWSATGSSDVMNGFLNRFLVFPMDYLPKPVDPKLSSLDDIPEGIIQGLRSLHCGGLGTQNDMSQFCMATNATRKTWRPVMVDWADQEAKKVWSDYRDEISEKHGQIGDSSRMAFYARTAESALRLATILALGRLRETPVVSVEDVKWGMRIAEWNARAMMHGAELHMADTPAQANAKQVLRIIKEAGGMITKRDLNRRLRHSLPKREKEDAIQSLIDSGDIDPAISQPKGGGTPTIRYTIVKDGAP